MTKDLMHGDELKDLVRSAYRSLELADDTIANKLYREDQLADVPQVSRDAALGVGNHLAHADISPGETLLDIGCGGGIDTVIAARRTGPEGRVIGLDVLPEMLERTSKAAAEAGLDNIETLEGEMESIPLPDDSIDHIISNGVLNLAARKARALAECARVLKPGGRFTVSDLTIDETKLPTEILTHPAAWAG